MTNAPVAKTLLIWNFDEKDKKNCFCTLSEKVDVVTNTVTIDERDPKAANKPKLVTGAGYSSKELVITGKDDLERAIESQKEELRRRCEEFHQFIIIVCPFWYKLSMIMAVTELGVWDRVSMIETSTLGIGKNFCDLKDDVLELPKGLLTGEVVSYTKRGRKGQRVGPENNPFYQRLPEKYHYLDFVKKVELDMETQRRVALRHANARLEVVNWNSFEDQKGTGEVKPVGQL